MASSIPASCCFGPFALHSSGVSIIEEALMNNGDDSIIEIPQNYVTIPDQEFPISTLATIPTFDMTHLVLLSSTTQAANDDELQRLHSACKDWGIFQLINHGVSSSLLDKVKEELENFFKLPLEEKMRYKLRSGDVLAEGYGTVVKSQDQKLDWGNRFFMFTNPINRRKPYLFPELPASLRITLESYMLELQRIARTLLGLMGKLLKMKIEMEELYEDGLQALRMTHYPPCPKPELVVGLKPHSDGSGITILHQVNGVQGLQIKKDGVWFPVSLDHGAFVVNVGDILEILSDGIYKSIEHRATVNSEKERISLAMFFLPKVEAEIEPLTSLRDPNKKQLPSSGKIGMEKFMEKFFAHNLNGKTPLERMRTKVDGDNNITAA